MIRGFTHKGLRRFFETASTAGIQPYHAKRLRLILQVLHRAKAINDMGFPGSGLHPLKGDMRGLWAVTVNGNWRITFRFEDGDAADVNYIDYH